MKVVTFTDPDYDVFIRGLNRRALPEENVRDTVAEIVTSVKDRGDAALRDYALKFDKIEFEGSDWFVTPEEFKQAAKGISKTSKRAIAASLKNITKFAKHSLRKDWSCRNSQGVRMGEVFQPYQRVGVYVPGGKAPLVSTALMTAGFAKAAKVPEILAATPCGPDGAINPALLYALEAAGVSEVIKLGGAQAIAAMALGTETIRPVERIFGPGNKYVVEAKRQLVGAVSIDLLPGPSEVLVLADKTGNPMYIAADLLAQAEHGGDSIAGLVTDSIELLRAVESEIARQIKSLSRADYIQKSLDTAGFAILVKDFDAGIELVNQFAPEHLVLVCEEEESRIREIHSSGAIYLGNYSAVAVGDFLAGPSHTLPTGGAGKSFSGLRADQFQHRTSVVKIEPKSLAKSLPHVAEFARLEGLDAHGHSVEIRVDIDKA